MSEIVNPLRERFERLRQLANIPRKEEKSKYCVLYESPQRMLTINTEDLDSNSGNYEFTLNHIKSSNYIGDYKDYKIYTHKIKNLTTDDFTRGNKTFAFFLYEQKQDIIIEKIIWQNFTSIGLCRNIIFDHYFKKCKQIISDDSHTEYGEKYWKKLIEESLKRKFKVFALCGDEVEQITSVEDSDIYFGYTSEYKDVRLSIIKI